MEQTMIDVPLARMEEDLDDPALYTTEYNSKFLPDNLYLFKRDDLNQIELDKQRTFYLTDEKFNVVKRAYLDSKDKKFTRNVSVAVVDAESGNVDYQLERKLSNLGCCLPFRSANLHIRSVNGQTLFSAKELSRGRTFAFTPIAGQDFSLHRKSTSENGFDIVDGTLTKLGTIAKRYTPINRRIRTRDGHYHIKFNENAADLEDEIKYVITLGCFLLDFLFGTQSAEEE